MRNCALIEFVIVASASCMAVATAAAQDPAICDDCKLLSTSDDATCSDFDPVTCKETTSDIIKDFPAAYDYEICLMSNYDYCKSPMSCLLDQEPADMHLELNYNNQSTSYGVNLTWPTLNSSCVTGYYVLEYNGNSADPSASCTSKTCYFPSNNAKFSVESAFTTDTEVKYVTFKVVAYPAYIWTVTYRVDHGQQPCLARCGKCSCQYHSAPTNLTWSRITGKNGMGNLSWDSDHDSSSVYYLHLNSSTSGKLLYLINGTKSSVILHNLAGNVTVWMESYNVDCGCSDSLGSQVLLIDTDAAPSPTAPSPNASSSTVSNSILSNTWIAVVLPLVLVMVILLVAIIITSGAFVVHRHRHNAHPQPFLCKVKICQSFSQDNEKNTNGTLPGEKDDDIKMLPLYKSSPESNDKYALLVFSQETPLDDQAVIRAYAQRLNKRVRVKMYDASDRPTRTAWLEEHHQSAVAILCVCNQAFANEWNNSSIPLGGSIVSAVRTMVQGKIEHQMHLEKFAVLHLDKKDVDCTPSYLKNVKSFLLSEQQIDSISHFALSVKEFDYQ